MSLVINTTNTATVPATDARALAPAPINNLSDYRVLSEGPGEVVLTNIGVSLTKPETVRFAISDIADIYKGTKVTPPMDGVGSRQGLSLLVQLNGVGYDSASPSTVYPYSANVVFKLPKGPNPTATEVIPLLERLLGHLYATSAATPNTRINALLHGALAPNEL